MKRRLPLLAPSLALALAVPIPALAQEDASNPSPNAIIANAPEADWVEIAPEDLLVLDLAPDAAGKPRRVIIQLMPPPFSQGWVDNIRTLARTHWFDGIAVVRVQDNYVVQWGDPNGEDEATAKPLPEGLRVMGEEEYEAARVMSGRQVDTDPGRADRYPDLYGLGAFVKGWPAAIAGNSHWPVHCYGMVGVGRGLSPDTGTGAELYTVIGHAPRHLDRNIALAGRIIEGMEHLSSLPRGHGDLGFYDTDAGEELVPIVQVRLASELEEDPASSNETVGQQGIPRFEYLSTESESFSAYAHARANRSDDFFIKPAGGADICNIPVPVQRIPGD